MAKYYGNSPLNANYRGVMTVTETATSTANNTSTISVTLAIYRADGYSSPYSRATGNHGQLVINGDTYDFSGFSVSMSGATSEANAVTIFTKTGIVIPHNADGSKKFDVTAKYWHDSSDSIGTAAHPLAVNGIFTCTLIARASDFTIPSNITMGQAAAIKINRAASTYVHTIKVSFNGYTATLTTSATTSYSWTPSVATYAPHVPNAFSGTCTVTVETHLASDSSLIGSVQKTVTLRVPTYTPTISTFTLSPSGSFSEHGIYVQGLSRANLTLAATGLNGATVSKWVVNEKTVTSPYQTDIFKEKGTQSIKVTMTDSRGVSVSQTKTVSVVAYAPPTLKINTLARCTSAGTLSDTGTYVLVNCTPTFSSVSGHNSATIKVAYKLSSAASYGTETTIAANTDVKIGGGAISADYGYDVRVRVTDTAGKTTTYVVTVPHIETGLVLDPNRKSMGIMVKPSRNNAIETEKAIYAPAFHGIADEAKVADTLKATGAAKDFSCRYFHIGAGTTTNIDIPNNFRGLVLIQYAGNGAGRHWLVSVVATSTGGVYYNVLAGSSTQVSIATSTNTLSVTSNSGSHYVTVLGLET